MKKLRPPNETDQPPLPTKRQISPPTCYTPSTGSITLGLSDDLATQLRAHQQHLPTILKPDLPELNANAQSDFDGAAAVLEL